MSRVAGDGQPPPGLITIHASIGQDFHELADEAARLCPDAMVVGASCSGVVGREGVSESMKDVVVMAVSGNEFEAAGVYGHNSHSKILQLAADLKQRLSDANMLYFMAPGINIANDECLTVIEEVFGSNISVFGATSSDNMKGLANYQIFGTKLSQHTTWLDRLRESFFGSGDARLSRLRRLWGPACSHQGRGKPHHRA